MAVIAEQTLAPEEILQVPSGWNLVSQQVYNDPAGFDPQTQAVVESFDFYTLTVFDQVIGSQPNLDQQLIQGVEQGGSVVYATALLHTVEFNVTVPTSFTVPSWVPGIGGNSYGVPGGGTVLASVDRYRWVIVHSIVIILALVVAAIIGTIALVWFVSHDSSAAHTLQQLGNGFTNFFVQVEQAPTAPLINAYLLTFGAGLLFTIGVYYFAYKSNKEGGGSAIPMPDLPPPPAVTPLALNLGVSQPSFRLGPFQTAATTAGVGGPAPPPVVLAPRERSGPGFIARAEESEQRSANRRAEQREAERQRAFQREQAEEKRREEARRQDQDRAEAARTREFQLQRERQAQQAQIEQTRLTGQRAAARPAPAPRAPSRRR